MSGAVTDSRIVRRFAKLKAQGRAGLVPFITANDPSPEVFAQILEGLPTAGADLIEIGMPFSDPMADGPSIQLSAQRALEAGVDLDGLLSAVANLREWEMDVPIILMGYYNPIYAYGPQEFAEAAANAGVDGLIVVDLPPEEAEELNVHLRANGLHMIFLAAPTSTDERLPKILEHASGFLYYVAVKGVTGTKSAEDTDIASAIERLRRHTDLPLAVGFGIRTAEQAARVARLADAAVVGSAIVDVITEDVTGGKAPSPTLAGKVLDYVKQLADGVRGAREVPPAAVQNG